MKSLIEVSSSIYSKRRKDLDTSRFPLDNLQLTEYDIRQNRQNNETLKKDLERNGQLQPITINLVSTDINEIEKMMATVVNGRTRLIEMRKERDKFPYVNVQVYENLTEVEENYLNASINVTQNPLTADEKLKFILRHKDELDPTALQDALGLGKAMFDKYMVSASIDEEAREAFKPEVAEGHNRAEIKIEEVAITVTAYKSVSGENPSTETLKAIGKKSNSMNMRRDIKRKAIPAMTKKVATYKTNKNMSEYSDEQLVEFASKEIFNSSGDTLPKNSSEKYKIIDNLLQKNSFDFAVILYAESLYRIDENGQQIESETKRIIDSVNLIIVVGNEIEKLVDIKSYALSKGKNLIFYRDDVIERCDELQMDNRRGFIYVNGASLYSQRPEFMNFLKRKYPNSLIAMVVIDLLFGKSQVCQSDRLREIITVYGGGKNFDEILDKFKKVVTPVVIEKYAETPQKKYIICSEGK